MLELYDKLYPEDPEGVGKEGQEEKLKIDK